MNTFSDKLGAKVLGILGGTFDPIHYGHIKPLLESADWLGLEQLILLPAHIPPHKEKTSASAHHRAAMVKLVCEENPRLQMDDRELFSNGPSYTVNTLKAIKTEFPEHQLLFFMGMDSLHTFTRWHNWQEILTYCHLIVNTRLGYRDDEQNKETQQLLAKHQIHDMALLKKCTAGKILFSPLVHCDVSSTLVRQRLKKKLSCHKLVPPAVIDYINEHSLYN
ncbi:nicotinate-nucleotide adenylyltransferase [Colwelliaceae bacterium 6471]